MTTKPQDVILDQLRHQSVHTVRQAPKAVYFIDEQASHVKEALHAAMADPSINTVVIYRYMKSLGFEGGETGVRNYRRSILEEAIA